MLIWVEKDNHLHVGDADNGWPLYSYVAMAPQNEEDLAELKEFAERHGYEIGDGGAKQPGTKDGEGDE